MAALAPHGAQNREAPVNPDDLQYTAEHEWVRLTDGTARLGITDYAQEALGDIVFVTLPAVGTQLEAGQSLGEVESTKSVSDIYAPFAGTVSAVNGSLDANPELVNSDAFGEGWMVELRPADGAVEAAGLLSREAYDALLP